ncbi:RNA polymerase sigma factor [Mangrovibacterium diazotrophicum]|uniref:RNA polymerase sigma factor (Sigma-70 family) n=1 Tax=Mangrovibacterium diazotrophicum TaxID=1261403 RepID=A0A419W5E3_9BACT|nr:RNA polymerase sigma factor [Mangrovibacterium diazotrophicum]RKD90667.1 RNA polymerase sigma factor (sigma-70 family) [Mangrovibacterium diazotrophicum]
MVRQDSIIWDEFKRGNEEAFSRIYHQYFQILYQYGFRFTQNQELIEDAVQDLFADLFKNRLTIGATDNIKLFLLKSFRRKLLRHLKKESRYTEESGSEINFGIHLSPEDNLILGESEQLKWIRFNRALERLSHRQREAVYLRFKKELDYDEVAAIMEMSVEACRNLIYRAVKSIRQMLEEESLSAAMLFIYGILKKD